VTSPRPPQAAELILLLRFQDDKAYIAPLGSSIHDTWPWIHVGSLTEIAERVGVFYRPESEGDEEPNR